MTVLEQEKPVIKEMLIDGLNKLLDKKIEAARQSIESAKESRESDTKNSAGDKYETGRAMMQFELEKNKVILSKALQLKNEILNIDLEKDYQKVEFGSVVLTCNGNYFISIGLGKLLANNDVFFSISLNSPIGSVLHKKKVGESVIFQGKKISITAVF